VRARLRQIWLDPLGLDPSRVSARVTREISARLADVARELEGAGHDPELVAGFLSRCLFCMFAEDVGLLPKRAFTELLESFVAPRAPRPSNSSPSSLPCGARWTAAASRWSCAATCRASTASCFKHPYVLPLDRAQIAHLLEASRSDWTLVEPAIFGTSWSAPSTPWSATPSAPTTRRAPMSSAWCCPR